MWMIGRTRSPLCWCTPEHRCANWSKARSWYRSWAWCLREAEKGDNHLNLKANTCKKSKINAAIRCIRWMGKHHLNDKAHTTISKTNVMHAWTFLQPNIQNQCFAPPSAQIVSEVSMLKQWKSYSDQRLFPNLTLGFFIARITLHLLFHRKVEWWKPFYLFIVDSRVTRPQ